MNIPGGTRAGISRPPARRSKSSPTTAASSSGRSIAAAKLLAGDAASRCSKGHPHWEEFGAKSRLARGRLKPLPPLFREEERSKQPSAFSDSARADPGVPRRGGFAPRPGRRVRLRPAVPVRAHREETAAPRPQGPAPLPVRRHLVHGSQEGADRALPVRFRARGRLTTRGLPRDGRGHPAAPARCSGPDRLRPHAAKSTWPTWRPCAKACAAATTTRSCCARRSRTPYSGKPSELFERMQRRQPQPLRVLPAVRRRATGRRFAGDVRAGGRAARRDLPDLGHGAAHRRSAARCREHPRAAEIRQGRVRADHVHRRGPQRQVARLRAGHA